MLLSYSLPSAPMSFQIFVKLNAPGASGAWRLRLIWLLLVKSQRDRARVHDQGADQRSRGGGNRAVARASERENQHDRNGTGSQGDADPPRIPVDDRVSNAGPAHAVGPLDAEQKRIDRELCIVRRPVNPQDLGCQHKKGEDQHRGVDTSARKRSNELAPRRAW